jgi:hypothetical protein
VMARERIAPPRSRCRLWRMSWSCPPAANTSAFAGWAGRCAAGERGPMGPSALGRQRTCSFPPPIQASRGSWTSRPGTPTRVWH